MLTGSVPPGAGQSLGSGELPGLVAVGGLADFTPPRGAVLLQLPLPAAAAGLGLGEHPRAAALNLNLGKPASPAERVVCQPLREVPGPAGVVLRVRDRRPQVQRVDHAAAHGHRREYRRVPCQTRGHNPASTEVPLSCIV
jgi:hypothetical protein